MAEVLPLNPNTTQLIVISKKDYYLDIVTKERWQFRAKSGRWIKRH